MCRAAGRRFKEAIMLSETSLGEMPTNEGIEERDDD